MDNVYRGHWSTDCNRVKYITMGNKKGSNYLSLNRKYPVMETTTLNTAIMPSQLVLSLSLKKYWYENQSPSNRGIYLVPSKPKPNIVIRSTTNEPTATMTNIFCLSFILAGYEISYEVLLVLPQLLVTTARRIPDNLPTPMISHVF